MICLCWSGYIKWLECFVLVSGMKYVPFKERVNFVEWVNISWVLNTECKSVCGLCNVGFVKETFGKGIWEYNGSVQLLSNEMKFVFISNLCSFGENDIFMFERGKSIKKRENNFADEIEKMVNGN